MAPIQLEKKKDGTRVRLLRCGYQHACGCPYLAKEVELINGEHCFFSGIVPHSEHNVLLDKMTGVPPQIKAVINFSYCVMAIAQSVPALSHREDFFFHG